MSSILDSMNTRLRAGDCDTIYNGEYPVQGLKKIINVDDIQEIGHLVVVSLTNDLRSMDGIYKITDLMLGNRISLKVKRPEDNGNSTIHQEYVGIAYNLYWVSQHENPEYFL